MSDYQTYITGKDDFSIDPKNLTAIKVEANEQDGKWTTYSIRAKLGMEAPATELLEWLAAGANLVVTWTDGKKYKLAWTEVVGD